MERRYMISDAAKLVDVEAHVLRYWEEELEINIPRNEMGHRYYTESIIQLFKNVKELKDRGFLLKAIKLSLPELMKQTQVTTVSTNEENYETGISPISDTYTPSASASSKMEQFQNILGDIVSKAIKENNNELGKSVSDTVSENVIKQMDYLLRVKEEHEEERFRKLDETIRNYQIDAKQGSRTHKTKNKKLFGLIGKNPKCAQH